eukprot:12403827-Alexandrium_andersonii.AAC.1
MCIRDSAYAETLTHRRKCVGMLAKTRKPNHASTDAQSQTRGRKQIDTQTGRLEVDALMRIFLGGRWTQVIITGNVPGE